MAVLEQKGIRNPLIGLEVEFQLIDKEGNISEKVDLLLQKTSSLIVPEVSQSMIEVLSNPFSDIQDLAKDITNRIQELLILAKEHGFYLLPSSPMGKVSLNYRDSSKFFNKQVLLGDDFKFTFLPVGTHVHVDRFEEKLLQQHALMIAMDPVFALMSSTPFSQGKNSLNNYRVYHYRTMAYRKFPLHGNILPYVYQIEELERRHEFLYNGWISMCQKNDLDIEGYTKFNTCWGPVRFSQKTIELRSCDSNLISNVLALAALQAGLHRQIELVELKNSQYYLDGKLLPSFEELKLFEQLGVQEGLKDFRLKAYLTKLVTIAKKGLRSHEKKFLKPFELMLSKERNFSDTITDLAKYSGLYIKENLSVSASKQLHLQVIKLFEDDLHETNKLLC